jgi:hypothetical protein
VSATATLASARSHDSSKITILDFMAELQLRRVGRRSVWLK